MNYEERVVDGRLHYRTTRDGPWVPVSSEVLTARMFDMIKHVRSEMEGIRRDVEVLVAAHKKQLRYVVARIP